MDLIEALSAKFSAPHYVFLREVRDATGFDSGRSADALALGMYRSRGRNLHGFEMKVSRGDLLRELKEPDKAEGIGQFCDFWWLLLSDFELSSGLDIPQPWGIYAPKGKKLHCYKPAEKLEPRPTPRYFLCALVKAAMDSIRRPAAQKLEDTLDKRFHEGVEAGQRNAKYEMEKAAELRRKVEVFEEHSGITINRWIAEERLPRIGQAVKMILAKEDQGEEFANRIRRQVKSMEYLVEEGRKVLEELDAQPS